MNRLSSSAVPGESLLSELSVGSTKAVRYEWLADSLGLELNQTIENIRNSADVYHVAVMPDVHQGKNFPNGLAIATKALIYPEAIGSDIGCGVTAVLFPSVSDIFDHPKLAKNIQEILQHEVPAIKHNKLNAAASLPGMLSGRLSSASLSKLSERDGRIQFGSLGRGNHFVEFLSDERGNLWLMVHSGSRGMGQAIFDHHIKGAAKANSGLSFLEHESEKGKAYIQDMEWAIDYATANRLEIITRIENKLEKLFNISFDRNSLIDSPHNFGRIEQHSGEDYFVHRKSALSANKDEIGLMPGSMATSSLIVCGQGNPDSLCSSSHGAGRTMSRKEAFAKISAKDLRRQMLAVYFNENIADKLRDEAPSAYRNIDRVMKAQRELSRREKTLFPLLNHKCV